MTRRTLRITSVAGLATLDRHLKLGGQAPFRLILALPGLPPDQRAGAEASLVRTLSACGCSEGAVGLLVAMFIGAVVSAALLPVGSGSLAWMAVLMAAGITGPIGGKVAGHLRARRRLAAEIARIIAMLPPLEARRDEMMKAA